MTIYLRTTAVAALSLSIWSGIAFSQSPAPSPDTTDGQSIAEAALIAAAIKIMEENVKAAGRENGEIDKLIRAMSGISVKDIQQYGVCGGKNSEVRKIAGNLCKPIS